jgi:hypothetical protein
MGSIPLITSLADPRNLSTILFVVGAFHLAAVGVVRRGGDVILLAVALLAIPFLPASNLFFPVSIFFISFQEKSFFSGKSFILEFWTKFHARISNTFCIKILQAEICLKTLN